MSEFINTIDVLGDDVVFKSIIDRTISQEFNDNAITKVGVGTFNSCVNLAKTSLPNVTEVLKTAFYKCSSLTLADLSKCRKIYEFSFSYSGLKSLILRRVENRCTLSSANAFNDTPIKSGTGYIYVPRALLSDDDSTKDYRRATNWTTYANQFRALEDYTVDGTITGALDESKI